MRTYTQETFQHGAMKYDVYRKGDGPAVIVVPEIPGISPQVLGFADRLVALGCSAVVPSPFGEAGRDPEAGGAFARASHELGVVASVCVRRVFTTFAMGKTAPVVQWLRALAQREHTRCGGPGVGVVGMCFTGGFALAMATDPRVLAPVLAQPSLPVSWCDAAKSSIDCSADDLERVKERCARRELRVLGLRFHGDPHVPSERFAFLRAQLGPAFVAVELAQRDGHPASPMRKHHSVLTRDLIDDPGEPTRAALDQVLAFLRERLL